MKHIAADISSGCSLYIPRQVEAPNCTHQQHFRHGWFLFGFLGINWTWGGFCTVHDMNVQCIFSRVLFRLTSSSIFQVLPEGSSLIFESLDISGPQPADVTPLGSRRSWLRRECFPNSSASAFRCLKMQIPLPCSDTPSHTLQPSSPWTAWLVWPFCLNMSQSGAFGGSLRDHQTMYQLNSSPWPWPQPFSILHGRPLPSAAAPKPFRPLPALLPFGFGMARPAASASSRPPGPPPQQANPLGQWPGKSTGKRGPKELEKTTEESQGTNQHYIFYIRVISFV